MLKQAQTKTILDNFANNTLSRIALLSLLAGILIAMTLSEIKPQSSIGLVESAATAKTELPELALPNVEMNGFLPHSSWSDTSIRPKLKSNAPSMPKITAKAYLAYDVDSGKILTSRNADAPLPVASITKLATALLVSRNLAPNQEVEVRGYMVNGLPNPVMGLVDGERLTVNSLMQGMLISSANDAAEVLAYALAEGDRAQAIAMMNNLAQNLNLSRTHYNNPTGFDDPAAYSTALDILTLSMEVMRTPWLMSILSEVSGEVYSADGHFVHKLNTTNLLLRNEKDLVLGGKTGFTDEARGNLVIFAKNPIDSKMIVILLGSESREAEMKELINWLHTAFEW